MSDNSVQKIDTNDNIERFVYAAETGNIPEMERLLASKLISSVNVKCPRYVIRNYIGDGHNITLCEVPALSIAAQEGHVEAVKWLLARGADVHAESYPQRLNKEKLDLPQGFTPIFFACAHLHRGIATMLAEHGAKTNITVNTAYVLECIQKCEIPKEPWIFTPHTELQIAMKRLQRMAEEAKREYGGVFDVGAFFGELQRIEARKIKQEEAKSAERKRHRDQFESAAEKKEQLRSRTKPRTVAAPADLRRSQRIADRMDTVRGSGSLVVSGLEARRNSSLIGGEFSRRK